MMAKFVLNLLHAMKKLAWCVALFSLKKATFFAIVELCN